jgi:phage replication O-like protein O
MSESPQLKAGYTRIANEIIEALAAHRIPGEQMQCLFVILRKTYGYQRKEARIPLNMFLEVTGMQKPNIIRALRWLRDKNIIVIKRDNENNKIYRFNKIYSTWRPLSKRTTLSKTIMAVIKNDNDPLSKNITEPPPSINKKEIKER